LAEIISIMPRVASETISGYSKRQDLTCSKYARDIRIEIAAPVSTSAFMVVVRRSVMNSVAKAVPSR